MIENEALEPAGRERRRNTRIDFDSSVELTFDDLVMRVPSSFNVSLGGVGIVADESVDIGAKCAISIFFNGASAELHISAKGQVVRCEAIAGEKTAWDLAVRFDEISDDSFYLLQNLILYNADDPDAVEAEFGPTSLS